MCKFMKALREREDIKKRAMENNYMDSFEDGYGRIFEPIQIEEDLWLSIQASYGHYCKPRKTLRDLDDYTHFEFALFTRENFVRVSDCLPELRSLAEIETYYEGTVYPYVPADLVEEIYLALN